MKTEIKKVGQVNVDAGICWIGDPCYILHREKKLPDTLGKDWSEFCNTLDYRGPVLKQFHHSSKKESPGLGVCVSSGFGDGSYPVFVEIKNDRVKKVWIEFFKDEDEELDNYD